MGNGRYSLLKDLGSIRPQIFPRPLKHSIKPKSVWSDAFPSQRFWSLDICMVTQWNWWDRRAWEGGRRWRRGAPPFAVCKIQQLISCWDHFYNKSKTEGIGSSTCHPSLSLAEKKTYWDDACSCRNHPGIITSTPTEGVRNVSSYTGMCECINYKSCLPPPTTDRFVVLRKPIITHS